MEEIIKMELIEKFIKEQGFTKTQFCKLCKISYGTFLKIKRGEDAMMISALFKIARVMGVPIKELFKK